jgi:uncharacterized protein
MTAATNRIGTIDWVDLTIPDADAACGFYASAFGWRFERSDSPMGVYHVAKVGGHQAAGIMAGAPGGEAPPAWTVFVRVASMEETVAAIGNSGGTVVVQPFPIPGDARVAVVSDPVGAMFAVIAGGPLPDPGEPPLRREEHGAVGWCELLSRDPHAAVSFYDAVFGWQAHLDTATGYTVLRLGDIDVAGMLPMPAEVPAQAPSHWLVYFNTSDLDATVEAVVKAGGSVGKPATTVGEIRFAVLADPAHAMFGVLALGT